MTMAFPTDWQRALIIVAHPDDPEYGLAPAVSKWTRQGKHVTYVLATSGEAGIEGMPPDEAGPLREQEQIRAGLQVGVKDIEFLGLPDSRLAEHPEELREAIAAAVRRHPAELVISLYRGPEWGPGRPNQADHIAVGDAVADIVTNAWLFENGPEPTHHVDVSDEDVQAAINSLAEHEVYLSVLDPKTPVMSQARAQVYRSIARDAHDIRVGLRLINRP